MHALFAYDANVGAWYVEDRSGTTAGGTWVTHPFPQVTRMERQCGLFRLPPVSAARTVQHRNYLLFPGSRISFGSPQDLGEAATTVTILRIDGTGSSAGFPSSWHGPRVTKEDVWDLNNHCQEFSLTLDVRVMRVGDDDDFVDDDDDNFVGGGADRSKATAAVAFDDEPDFDEGDGGFETESDCASDLVSDDGSAGGGAYSANSDDSISSDCSSCSSDTEDQVCCRPCRSDSTSTSGESVEEATGTAQPARVVGEEALADDGGDQTAAMPSDRTRPRSCSASSDATVASDLDDDDVTEASAVDEVGDTRCHARWAGARWSASDPDEIRTVTARFAAPPWKGLLVRGVYAGSHRPASRTPVEPNVDFATHMPMSDLVLAAHGLAGRTVYSDAPTELGSIPRNDDDFPSGRADNSALRSGYRRWVETVDVPVYDPESAGDLFFLFSRTAEGHYFLAPIAAGLRIVKESKYVRRERDPDADARDACKRGMVVMPSDTVFVGERTRISFDSFSRPPLVLPAPRACGRGSTTVTLEWDPVVSPYSPSVRLEVVARALDAVDPDREMVHCSLGSAATAVTIRDLAPETRYAFFLRTFSWVDRADSAEVEVTTRPRVSAAVMAHRAETSAVIPSAGWRRENRSGGGMAMIQPMLVPAA